MNAAVNIVGGGVAGCVLAHALKRSSVSSRVFERNVKTRFSGGALLLWSNAMHALKEVGLDEGPLSFGQRLDCIDFCASNGRRLWRLRADRLARANDAPCMLVPRARFLDYLDCAVSELTEYRAFRRHVQAADQVTCSFDDGSSATSQVLVGADGLRSLVRQQLDGCAPELRVTGQAIWVGVTSFRHPRLPPGRAVASVGSGLRFWAAALPGERVYWYAIFPEGLAPRDGLELSKHYLDFHAPVSELIATTPADAVAKSLICDRHPTQAWGQGRVTLLGDAVHPVTPDLGQGACQAIESAVTLAEQLVEHGATPAALRRYEQKRRARTARVSNLSYITAVNSMVRGRLACALRNAGISTLLPFVAAPQLRWITRGRHAG